MKNHIRQENLSRAAEWLSDQTSLGHNVAVLCGAGLSAPSGIATFRKGGHETPLWKKIPALSATDWRYRPQEVWQFLEDRIAIHDEQPQPVAHLELVRLLALLQRHGSKCTVVTQNLDLLLEEAINRLEVPKEQRPEIIHIHGTLGWRCSNCQSRGTLEQGKPPHKCPTCHAGHEQFENNVLTSRGLRPDVVLFEEDLPSSIYQALEEFYDAHTALVCGSSLEVTPAGTLPLRVSHHGGHIIVCDEVLPERLRYQPRNSCHWIDKDISTSLRDLLLATTEKLH